MLWDAILDLALIRVLMLHLVYPNKVERLVCSDQWNQLSTMLKTILLKHDGG